jgi:KipI family sensor histidine kinase inhibitor
MRILPSGATSLLVELDDLDAVLALYAALVDERPDGVVDLVPAARTVLVVGDPGVTSLAALEAALRRTTPRADRRVAGELVEVPVTYDGEDLASAAGLLGCDPDELVRRHTADEWVVAFCGFAPGFGYLTSPGWPFAVPRRSSPRTRVPAGAVGLAGEFSGVYPRPSPGGWQLVGRTELAVFDLSREPAALLRPGTRVRFVDAGTP